MIRTIAALAAVALLAGCGQFPWPAAYQSAPARPEPIVITVKTEPVERVVYRESPPTVVYQQPQVIETRTKEIVYRDDPDPDVVVVNNYEPRVVHHRKKPRHCWPRFAAPIVRVVLPPCPPRPRRHDPPRPPRPPDPPPRPPKPPKTGPPPRGERQPGGQGGGQNGGLAQKVTEIIRPDPADTPQLVASNRPGRKGR